MSFILRTWAYFCNSKSVSLASLALIVSTQTFVLCALTSFAFTPVITSFLTFPPGAAGAAETKNDNPLSNITLLDLYPELKEYLWKKALLQLTSTTAKSAIISPTETPSYGDYNANGLQNGWGWGTDFDFNGGENGQVNNAIGSGLTLPMSASKNGIGVGQWNSRDSTMDSDMQSSYNYDKEVMKYWHPFGTPEFYDSWKFKPSPPVSSGWGGVSHHHPPPRPVSSGWSGVSHHPPPPVSPGWSSVFPFWEEEDESHQVTQELSKDFSCLAGLLGLKTLKTLKFAAIFKKLKLIAISFVAFKLGVLLSPVAIPLLFPIIILVTLVKVLPLILIIVLLLKILKKQVKIKKPFGKFLDNTGSLFFDDVESVTEKVLNSHDEYIDKLSTGLQKRSKGRSQSNKDTTKRVNGRILD